MSCVQTNLLRDDRGESTEKVTLAVNDDRLGGEGGHLLILVKFVWAVERLL